ncbi:MAG: 1-acyl-sn-glycerol-3-phosphate acyltransferase [Spirochaetaceae bacterium]
MSSIDEGYEHITEQLIRNSRSPREISPKNVFQPANKANRPLINQILKDLLLEGSHLRGYEHLQELYRRCRAGDSCLILMEHYSNFDIPGLYYFLEAQGDEGSVVADAIVSMAGMKLNVESDFIRAFTEAYSRIVIYPSRSLESVSDPDHRVTEERRAKQINNAALHHMVRLKHEGHLILVFPTGTRYRPAQPETGRVLPVVDSYIKSFDNMVMIGIAGNILRVAEEGVMTSDRVARDVVVYNVGEVVDCRSFRDEIRSAEKTGAAAKAAVASVVQERLKRLHDDADAIRRQYLPK